MTGHRSPRDYLNHLKKSRRTIISLSILILLVNLIAFGLMHIFSRQDTLEHIEFTPNYDIILTESKTFWKGVWFKSDRLFILRNEFMIEKNALIGETKTIHIPYDQIGVVAFEEGLDIFTISIDRMNFYVKSRYRYNTIKASIIFKSKKRFRTIEEKTVFSMLSR